MIKSKAAVRDRKKRSGLVALTLAIAALHPFPTLAQDTKTEIIIATGPSDSLYHQTGVALCNYINKRQKAHSIHCTAQSTLGSIANANKLRDGEVQFAIVQSDVQFYSFKGYGPFKGKGPDRKIRSVISLYQEPFTVVARTDANIKTFEDLKGKRVNIGNFGSGQRTSMKLLMRMKGWTQDDFALATVLPPSKQAEALCANQIDAMVIMVGHPSEALKATMASCPVTLVHVTGPAIDRLIQTLPYYHPMSIAGDLYPGSTLSTRTFGVNATLVTSSETPAPVVTELLQALFNNFTNFKFFHAAFIKLNPKDMDKVGLTAPLHPSAKLYFKKADNLSELLAAPTPPQQ